MQNKDFLFSLLEQAAPSGKERRASDVWLNEASSFARTSKDSHGNAYAEVGDPESPAIVLMGHLDEIGLIVSHIDETGFISVINIGGWDPQVLVGQRIRLLAPEADILGVIGKKAVHTMDAEDRNKASKLEDLWIDTGLATEEVKSKIPVGTYCVIEQPPVMMGNKIVSRALDNRIGAFIVLEALRAVSTKKLNYRVVAVGTSQEEIGAFGAKVSGYSLNPVAGIVVDVTHETKQKGVSEQKYGVVPFGSGANITVGPVVNSTLVSQLTQAAAAGGIPYSLSASGRFTGTDADNLAVVRAGVPAAVISVPNRYMHSPNEMIDESDVQACINLITAWLVSLPASVTFEQG